MPKIVYKPTLKEIRAWCRDRYGVDWWKEDKKNRKKEARRFLVDEASTQEGT